MSDGRLRHRFFYALARLIMRPFNRLKFGLTAEPAPVVEGPCFILSNHVTDFDMTFVGLSFKKQMYYVASEHIFRWGFLSKVIMWTFAPIARAKGGTDGKAAIDILRALKKGQNVCLFAEGNRSFDGRNFPVHPTLGRLAKSSGATLITYRIEGGYLTSPRWSAAFRRGRIRGHCVNVYPPERLREMTAEEVYRAITSDIRENAFERQQEEHTRFRGKRLAEYLETALYSCPKCGSVSTLTSSGDRFRCSCGYEVRYTEYGLFEGEDLVFETVSQWFDWQIDRLRKSLAEDPAIEIRDPQVHLRRVFPESHRAEPVCDGAIRLSPEKFSIGEFSVPTGTVSALSLIGRNMLMFTDEGRNYEVTGPANWSALKYLHAYEILREKE